MWGVRGPVRFSAGRSGVTRWRVRCPGSALLPGPTAEALLEPGHLVLEDLLCAGRSHLTSKGHMNDAEAAGLGKGAHHVRTLQHRPAAQTVVLVGQVAVDVGRWARPPCSKSRRRCSRSSWSSLVVAGFCVDGWSWR
jgi:hypothetical protein